MSQEDTTTIVHPDALELADIFGADEIWKPMQRALRLSGVPLNDGDGEGDGEGANGSGDGDGDDKTKSGDGDGDDKDRQTFDREYVEKLRRENAQHRTRATEAETKVKKFEDLSKSEKDKLEERATKAETESASNKGKADRYEAAAKAGLDLKYAPRLQGSTPEELEADAKELVKDLGGQARGGSGGDAGRRRPSGEGNGNGAMNDEIRRRAGVTS